MKKLWKRKGHPGFPYEIKERPLEIVADGVISTDGIGDGRFVPAVILDTTARPDVTNLFAVHGSGPPGDVTSVWCHHPDYKDQQFLGLWFHRPIEGGFFVCFGLWKRGIIVDLARKAAGIYLQAGKVGDRVGETFGESPHVMAELGCELSEPVWTQRWTKSLVRRFRAEGYNRTVAKQTALKYVSHMREQFSNPRTFVSRVTKDIEGGI